MSKLNKLDLVDMLCDKCHLSKKEAREAVDSIFDEISDNLLKGNEVNITNFGTFIPKSRSGSKGTDPKPHAPLEIKPARTVLFKLSKVFKSEINQ